MKRTREIPTHAAVLLASLVLGAIVGGAGFAAADAHAAIVVNPLLNAGFEIGLPEAVRTDGPAGAVVLAGSVLPGATEDNAILAVPPWTIHAYRESRMPFSNAFWGLGAGAGNSSALVIDYDARDRAAAALAIEQAIGQPIAGGAFHGCEGVRLAVATDKPIVLRAALWTQERPHLPQVSPAFMVYPEADGNFAQVELPLVAGSGTLTRFAILLTDGGVSDGARVVLDEVELLGTYVV